MAVKSKKRWKYPVKSSSGLSLSLIHIFAIEDKSLARFGMGYIGHLLLCNVKLLGKDFPVALGLVEHIDKIAVFKNV